MKLKAAHLVFNVTKMSKALADSQGWRAVCDMDDLEIQVDMRRPPAEQAELLLHEILHAYWWAVGWSEKGLSEEDAVLRASRAQAALFVDNEWLFKALHEATHKGKPLPL